MSREMIRDLVIETLTTPTSAARKVVAYDAPRAALWTALALVAVLNGVFYSLILPAQAEAGPVFQAIGSSPIKLTVFIGVSLAATAYLMTFSGQVLGGQANVTDLLKVTIWLQSLRLALQVFTSFLLLIFPLLGWLVSLVAGFWGLWVLVSFVSASHKIEMIRAVGVMVMTFVVMIVVMSFLTASLGLAVPAGDI